MLKFKCKELSISDEPFGCTVTFSDSFEQEFYETHNYDDVNEDRKYLLLQRSYAEGDFEQDYSYIESSDLESAGKLGKCKIELYRDKFVVEWNSTIVEIELREDENEFKKLVEALKIIVNDQSKLNIHS